MLKTLRAPRSILLRNLAQCLRLCSNAPKIPTGLPEKPDARQINQDYIGPPDKLSNLRPYVRCIPVNESELAKRLREQRNKVEAWNQDFWTKHNKRFYDVSLLNVNTEEFDIWLAKSKEREDFIRLHSEAGNNDVSADQMSKFYKSFLDKNRKLHLLYNISWYIKNFDLLLLAAMVNVQKLLPKKTRKNT